MRIENLTLAHFRHFRHFSSLYFTLAHFRHFSSLFTLSHLYICRDSSTNQPLFMQNKPNFQSDQMNVSNIITRIYKNILPLAGQKNKPNSNPIKTNFKCPQTHQRSGKKKGPQKLFLGLNCRKGYTIVYGKSRLGMVFSYSIRYHSYEGFWVSLRITA